VRGVETRAGALRQGRRGEGLKREHSKEVKTREGGGEGRDTNISESKQQQ
jgi:hypothetical protein